MKNIKLVKREADFRIYKLDDLTCEVKLCLNPNLYVKTGYYITFNNQECSQEVLKKSYRSGKLAANAYFKDVISKGL